MDGSNLGIGSTSGSEEDYDALKIDPDTLRDGSRVGFAIEDASNNSDNNNSLRTSADTSFEESTNSSSESQPILPKPKIPLTLDKINENGRYVLTADDDAIRSILKMGLERENNAVNGKKKYTKFSDLAFTRRFTTFDRQNRQNVETVDPTFQGFFVLFWLATAIYMLKIAAENWRKHGNILGTNEIMGLMFRRDVMVLALADGVMCASTGFGLVLQKLILRGWISWNKEGWVIQTIWGALYLAAVLEWTLFREWPWTHTIFFVIHGLVMLMKQHSYAFYNGHLSEQYKLRQVLLRKLKQLERISPSDTASTNSPLVASLSTEYLDGSPDLNERQTQRRGSGDQGASNLARIAAVIESGEALELNQIYVFERIIKFEIDSLEADIKGKCTTKDNEYPKNLTMANHYEYILLPTLVYELEYPRSDSINWCYVAEKLVAVFGILMIMNMVSQTYIYPVVVQCNEMKDAGLSLGKRLEAFPWILSDLMFPFMTEYMMTWYVLWECILNLLAELTYFADRGFYGDWWNSVSWDQFARDWNRPVHNFLLRHVYHSSISSMKVNKNTATLITFFLSACVHELVMWCLFKKLRGYLLVLQMSQLPLVQLSRSRFLKGKATLGNLMFWIGLFTGPSLLCSLYLIL